MHKLGISVYPDIESMDDIREYLKLASKYGVSRVFSSMFQLQGSREEVLDYFRDFIKEAHKYGMEVSLDVNPEFLERMGVTPDDFSMFKDIECDIVRMDGCYGDERDIQIINNPHGLKIEFNTSMILDHIKDLIEAGADPKRMVSCHNFYPQPYTGMEWEKFKKTNRDIKAISDVDIAAFVSSNEPNTHGVWDAAYGLPTVEKMRHYPIDLQARLLLATDDVDDILIGNAFASEKDFQDLAEVVQERTIPEGFQLPFSGEFELKGLTSPKKVKVVLEEGATDTEKEVLFDFPFHADMGDSSEWIWRSRMPRMVYKGRDFSPRDAGKDTFEVGDIVMVNDNYKHYAGEVQIVMLPMKNDGLRNLVGHLEGAEKDMLELLKPFDVVQFVEQKA